MPPFRLLFSTDCLEAFGKLPRSDREVILEKLEVLAQFPLQPETVITSADGLALDIKTLGNWTFGYRVDFPAKTIIVVRFMRIPRKPREK